MHVQNCFANKTYYFLTFPLPSSSWFRQVQAATATKTAGLISNNFARAAHFFCSFLCRCFARRQRETSRNSLVTRFMEEMLYVVLFTFFFATGLFYLGGCQHFTYSHSRYKIFMLFFKRNWSSLFFISGSSSFSVIHTNLDFKIKLKERIGFVVVVFYL